MTTLGDVIDDWRSHRARMVDLQLVRESTWKNQSQIADQLKAKLGNHHLTALRKSHIELYAGGRLKTCEGITVQGELNVLRQILNWAIDEQLMTERPRMPTVAAVRTEPPLPADGAFVYILRIVPPSAGRALEFMMLTGLSPHELEQLQPRDLVLAQRTVSIGGRDDFLVKQESRRRTVPLNARAWTIWYENSAGLRQDAAVFPSGIALQKAIVRARKQADKSTGQTVPGAEKITPKMMRKWFASKVASEQPEHVLQRLLGHAPGSPITRRHYVRSQDEQLVGAVQGVRA